MKNVEKKHYGISCCLIIKKKIETGYDIKQQAWILQNVLLVAYSIETNPLFVRNFERNHHA